MTGLANIKGAPILLTLVLAAALAYSAVHFAYSGVIFPLSAANLGQVEEELPPVRAYLESGRPVHLDNPRQYGPTFFFVLHPLLLFVGDDADALSRWLYALQLLCLGVAFTSSALVLRRWVGESNVGSHLLPHIPDDILILLLLWMNFAPLLYILAIKNVETWELALIAFGWYSFTRERRFVAGFCIALAALAKMLPLFFLAYFLVVDRRTFAYCCLSLFLILSVSHVIYGAEVGYLYLPFMLTATSGNTWALTYHENVSLKGMVVKAFAGWQMQDVAYETSIDAGTLAIANLVAQALQAAGVLWMMWVLNSARLKALAPMDRVVWGFAFANVLMLVLSPQTAFEYMVLSLPAFSFALVAVVLRPSYSRRARIWLAGAIVFVAVVVPRSILNRLLPLATLNALAGNEQLTRSEAYQYYGFPLLGLFCLLAAIWTVREWRAPAPASARSAVVQC